MYDLSGVHSLVGESFQGKNKLCFKHSNGDLVEDSISLINQTNSGDIIDVEIEVRKEGAKSITEIVKIKVVDVDVRGETVKTIMFVGDLPEHLKGVVMFPTPKLLLDFLLHGIKRSMESFFSLIFTRQVVAGNKEGLNAASGVMSEIFSTNWNWEAFTNKKAKSFRIKIQSSDEDKLWENSDKLFEALGITTEERDYGESMRDVFTLLKKGPALHSDNPLEENKRIWSEYHVNVETLVFVFMLVKPYVVG